MQGEGPRSKYDAVNDEYQPSQSPRLRIYQLHYPTQTQVILRTGKFFVNVKMAQLSSMRRISLPRIIQNGLFNGLLFLIRAQNEGLVLSAEARL
jgi:hypothetical protein